MEIYDVVIKLVGPVMPVGDTNEDNRRYEALKTLIEITDKLLSVIDDVSSCEGAPEYSVNRAGCEANDYLKRTVDLTSQ